MQSPESAKLVKRSGTSEMRVTLEIAFVLQIFQMSTNIWRAKSGRI